MTTTDADVSTVRASAADETAPQQRLEDAVLAEAPALLRYLVRRVPEPSGAADLLSEVLLVVWRRIDVMPAEPEQARMWMFGIARKVLAVNHRSRRRRHALADRLRGELATASNSADLSGATTEPVDPRVELLEAALRRLSPADRDIIALVHRGGFTLAQVASHLHLVPTTTRSRYHRARKRLRRQLESVGADEG